MSLEGLRAWIGEVERKLGKRTRVFLALAVIAIGIAGAAVYLAIDARNSAVDEGEVQELQRELEAQIDEAAAGQAPSVTPPAGSEPEPLPEGGVEPKPESAPGGGSPPDAKGADSTSNGATDGASGDAETGGAAAGGTSKAKIQELLEQAKEQNAEAEEEQAGK